MPVARAAEAFKLDRLKGELDYHKPRPIGYKPTKEELEYLYNDVYIVAEILRQITDEGMTRLTVASDSMAEYKSLITTKRFNTLFPVLSLGMDREIRRAYRGGFAYADKRHQMKRTGSGIVLDVNSLYPYIMYTKALPYGMPEYFNGEPAPTETHPLTTFTVTFTARLKKRHIPCIQVKGSLNFGATEYLSVIDEPTTLTVTNVDWELWNEHYDITPIEWAGGWRFRSAHDLFKEYIEKWSKIKAESTGGKREIAKLHLNSLYGRFAANPNVTGKCPYLKDGIVRYSPGEEQTRNPVYTAMAAFITAYARELTIHAAQVNYDTFAYADTDSLHLLTDEVPEGIDVDPHRMGAWKREYGFSEALYVRAKFYLERVSEAHQWLAEGDVMVKVAGLPDTVTDHMSFPDVYDGNVLTGKLQPRNVPGGVVLVDTDFTIKL